MFKKVYQIIKANIVFDKLIKQQIGFEINVAYRIYKLKKELDEIEEFVMDRLTMLLGDGYDLENLDNNEKILYEALMMDEMKINVYELNINDIINVDGVKLQVDEMEKIAVLLEPQN